MRVVAVVQARMGSSRIPGKVLAEIQGQPMVLRIVNRVAGARSVAAVGISTSTAPGDDPLADLAVRRGLPCFRGPVDDIVTRLNDATSALGGDVAVRVWGDCPFIDAAAIDRGVATLQDRQLDFATNAAYGRRTYPPGLDFEVYRGSVLATMDRDVTAAAEREFPVEFVRKHADRFRMGFVDCDEDLSALHLTVDYPEDLTAVRAICALLEADGRPASFGGLVALLRQRPELTAAFSPRARNIEYKAYLAGQTATSAA